MSKFWCIFLVCLITICSVVAQTKQFHGRVIVVSATDFNSVDVADEMRSTLVDTGWRVYEAETVKYDREEFLKRWGNFLEYYRLRVVPFNEVIAKGIRGEKITGVSNNLVIMPANLTVYVGHDKLLALNACGQVVITKSLVIGKTVDEFDKEIVDDFIRQLVKMEKNPCSDLWEQQTYVFIPPNTVEYHQGECLKSGYQKFSFNGTFFLINEKNERIIKFFVIIFSLALLAGLIFYMPRSYSISVTMSSKTGIKAK